MRFIPEPGWNLRLHFAGRFAEIGPVSKPRIGERTKFPDLTATENPEGGRRSGRRTPDEWAAEWVRKFGVYHARRFGAGARVAPEQVEDFLRFITTRWGAPDWQQAQARQGLEEWMGKTRAGPGPEIAGQHPAPHRC